MATLLALAASGAVFAGSSAVAAVDAGTGWKQPVTLAVKQNTGNFAQTTAVSCASPGNCGAIGYYGGASGRTMFVADETAGTWASAQKMRMVAGHDYDLTAVACPSAGNCVAVGEDTWSTHAAFTLDEVAGTWGKPHDVGGVDVIDPYFNAVACTSAGNCVAGGTEGYGGRAFVATETAGTWGKGHVLAGKSNVDAAITSISCPSAGNCVAGGSYDQQPYGPLPGVGYPFVVSEAAGTWGALTPMKGPFDHTNGDDAVDNVTSVSCSSTGNCAAGGYYGVYQGARHAFVASEAHGVWSAAKEVAASLDVANGGWLASVSCPADGRCAGAGAYVDHNGDFQTFTIDEVGGTWKAAREVGATVNVGGYGWLSSISCASAGNCSAAGFAANSADGLVGLVVTEKHGTWDAGAAVVSPAIADAGAELLSISCPAANACTAGGYADDASDHQQAVVVDQ